MAGLFFFPTVVAHPFEQLRSPDWSGHTPRHEAGCVVEGALARLERAELYESVAGPFRIRPPEPTSVPFRLD